MKRKIARNEMHETVINLIDLGFTAPAVAYMVSRSGPVVYKHLKSGGRMKGNRVTPHPTCEITEGAASAMRRVFSHQAFALAMVAVSYASNNTR